MGQTAQFIMLAVSAYFLGSVPAGKIAGRLNGIDIQKRGSGNIGFANVRRVLGWRVALPVLIFDVLKGYLLVLLAKHYLSLYQVMAMVALVVAGHLFPVWLKFHGGKGVATTIGVAIAINPWTGIISGIIYVGIAVLLRVSAVGSLAAVYSLPFLMLAFSPSYFWLFAALALVITWAHRENIRGMARGRARGSAQKS